MSLRILDLTISSPSCRLRSLEVAVVPDHWIPNPAPILAASRLPSFSAFDSHRGPHREGYHFKSSSTEGSWLSSAEPALKACC